MPDQPADQHGTHITFQYLRKTASRKTEIWILRPKNDPTILGYIKWYGAWRKYALFPNQSVPTIFEEVCLREVANFCVDRTRMHKAGRTQDVTT